MNKMNKDFINFSENFEVVFKKEQLSNFYKYDFKIDDNIIEKIKELNNSLKECINLINNNEDISKFIESYKKYEEEVMEHMNLDETNFKKVYSKEIKLSKKLGENGWVISQFSNPSIINKWEELLSEGEESISNLFEKDDDINIIIEGLNKKYVKDNEKLYFSKGIQAFNNKDYMASSMFLIALLENRVSKWLNFDKKNMRNKEKYSENAGFKDKISEDFERFYGKEMFMKKKTFIFMYTSLIAYLSRVFIDGLYTFEKGNEPPYLNRNWLMHGRMVRDVKKYECIQVLNALSVVEFMAN